MLGSTPMDLFGWICQLSDGIEKNWSRNGGCWG